MSFKLKKAVFNIKCKNPNCKFDINIDVKQNILGFTEKEVEDFAKKSAYFFAKLKHDSDNSIDHAMKRPLIDKKSCICEAFNTSISLIKKYDDAIKYLEYKKGEVIIKKEDIVNCICEVVKGNAFSSRNKNKLYNVGDSFGASHLLINQKKNADIIAGKEGATIAFYNLRELSLKDPNKAKELYQKSMDDIIQTIFDMENELKDSQSRFEHETIEKNNFKENLKLYEKKLKEVVKLDKKV